MGGLVCRAEEVKGRKSKFIFDGTAVLELLAHAKTALLTTSPYGLTKDPGPGLILVKDDGVYVMSNGEFGLPGKDDVNKVVYARGYEALPTTGTMEQRMAQYDKIRDAAGGDDFAEFIPARNLTALEPRGLLEIELTLDKMTIAIVRAPLEPIVNKKAGRTQSS